MIILAMKLQEGLVGENKDFRKVSRRFLKYY
jgi:hypothetical protein